MSKSARLRLMFWPTMSEHRITCQHCSYQGEPKWVWSVRAYVMVLGLLAAGLLLWWPLLLLCLTALLTVLIKPGKAACPRCGAHHVIRRRQ